MGQLAPTRERITSAQGGELNQINHNYQDPIITSRRSNRNGIFDVLADQNEIETDSVRAEDDAEHGSQQMRTAMEGLTDEEVVRETQMAIDEEGNQVNLSVSHEGLAEGLRPLSSMRTNLRVQAQGSSGGPKKINGKALRDISNKLDIRPQLRSQEGPHRSRRRPIKVV